MRGKVTNGGDPVLATVVAQPADLAPGAWCGSSIYSTATDAGGRYTFTSPTAGGNNWGLSLLGDGSAAGERTFYIRACHALAQPCSQAVLLKSNELKVVNVDLEEPTRCHTPPGKQPQRPETSGGHPVNFLNGTVWFDHTDIALPTPTGPVGFTRSYCSRLVNQGVGSRLGPGWTHSFGQTLEFLPTGSLRVRQADRKIRNLPPEKVERRDAADFPNDIFALVGVAGGRVGRQRELETGLNG